MALTKTLDPAGVLLAVNGHEARSQQAVEDIVDEIVANKAALTNIGTVTGDTADGTALRSLLDLLDAAGVITDESTDPA